MSFGVEDIISGNEEGHVLKDCRCDFGEKGKPISSAPGLAEYLRRLASRIEAGEIRHVSISVHPVRDVRQD